MNSPRKTHGFGGMIQSTTEPIGQPLVIGSGAMLVILYIILYVYIYIYIIDIYIYIDILSGWWFGTLFFFPFTWECHHPNWLIFFRGVGIPPTRWFRGEGDLTPSGHEPPWNRQNQPLNFEIQCRRSSPCSKIMCAPIVVRFYPYTSICSAVVLPLLWVKVFYVLASMDR